MSNHWKKILAAGMAGAFLLTAVPVVAVELSSPVYAAKGGARFSAPKSAPKPAPKAAAPSGNTQKADKPLLRQSRMRQRERRQMRQMPIPDPGLAMRCGISAFWRAA